MRGFICAFLTVLVAGCSTIPQPPRPDQLEPEGIAFSGAELATLVDDASAYPDGLGWEEVVLLRVGAGHEAGEADTRSRIDELLANLLLSKSDAICEDYFTRVIVTRNSAVAALDIGSLATSGAAALAAPERSANLLGGISSFLTGTRTSLEQTILDGVDIRELRRASRAARQQSRTNLHREMSSLDGTAQLIFVAGRLGDYHAQCGIEFGSDARSEAVDQAVRRANDEAVRDGKREAEETPDNPTG